MSIFKRSKKSDPAGRADEVDGVETLEGQGSVDTDADGTQAVSYTHLTLPTNREV